MSPVLTTDLRAIAVGYKAANQQLQRLAARLNARLSGYFGWLYDGHEPVIDAVYRGYNCRVFGMNQPWRGDTNTSISCIVELPQRTRFRLATRNVEHVSTNFFVNLEPTEPKTQTNLPDEALEKVLPVSQRGVLERLTLPYALLINYDRITFTAYSLYEHDFYLRVLDMLTEMATQLLEIE